MSKDNRLIVSAIEFDGSLHQENTLSNYKAYHQCDILKQYYAYKLNICLLRLTDEHNIESEVDLFIDQILKTNVYVAQNIIQPIEKYFTENRIHSGIKNFNEQCIHISKMVMHQINQMIKRGEIGYVNNVDIVNKRYDIIEL